MATLKFYYGTMYAGKTTYLCNAYDILTRKKLSPVVLKPIIDDREGEQKGWGYTQSRNGNRVPAYYFSNLKEELYKLDYGSIIVDEAQFMTREDVLWLTKVVDKQDINVLAYGLKTDVNGNLFEGSAALLALADEATEITSLCQIPECTNKAQLHMRFIDGKVDKGGASTAIEKGNVTYKSVCRKCWNKEMSR